MSPRALSSAAYCTVITWGFLLGLILGSAGLLVLALLTLGLFLWQADHRPDRWQR